MRRSWRERRNENHGTFRMRYLLPLLCCAVVFFGGRQFRVMREAAAVKKESTAVPAHHELYGLARQAERQAKLNAESATAVDALYRSGDFSDEEIEAAVGRAMQGDAVATWKWIGGLPESERRGKYEVALQRWFRADSAAAVKALEETPGEDPAALANGLLLKIAGPDAALAAGVRQQVEPLVGLVVLLAPGEDQVQVPPRDAAGAELLVALPAGKGRDVLLGEFAGRWLAEDFKAARTFLERQPAELRQRIMERFVARLGDEGQKPTAEQFGQAGGWLAKEATPELRAQFGPGLADSMATAGDAAGAMKWATANLQGAALEAAIGKILERTLAKDPPEARKLVEGLPAGVHRVRAAGKVAEAGLGADAAAAISWWLEQVGGSADNDTPAAMARMGGAWIGKSPDSFRDWLADPGAAVLPGAVLAGAMKPLFQKREAALDWISGLPAARRGPVLRAAYGYLAADSPEKAAAIFDSRPDLATGEAAGIIAVNWYGADEPKAIAWAAGLPWGGQREAALAGLKRAAESKGQSGAGMPAGLRELLR